MSDHTVVDGIDYGPLAALIGTWQGDKGVDRAPEPDGEERNPYYETIFFQAAGDVTNADQQTLSVVRYHQAVSRKSNNEVFHDQVGYWLWDPADNTIVETFTHALTVKGDEMRYSEITVLDIYDKTGYQHKDVNTLRRTD